MSFFSRKSNLSLVAIHVHINLDGLEEWLSGDDDPITLDQFNFSSSISFRVELIPHADLGYIAYHCHEGIHRREIGCEFLYRGFNFECRPVEDHLSISVDRKLIGLAPLKYLENLFKTSEHRLDNYPVLKGQEIDLYDENSVWFTDLSSWRMLIKANSGDCLSFENRFTVIEFAAQSAHHNMVYYENSF